MMPRFSSQRALIARAIHRITILAALAIAVSTTTAIAQPEDSPEAKRAARIQAQAFEALNRNDLVTAERLLRTQAEIEPENFVPPYNLACTLSRAGKLDESLAQLQRAINLGFVDRLRLSSDPDLAAVRKTPAFTKMLESWPRVLEDQSANNVERAKAFFPADNRNPYQEHRDEALRLIYWSSMDAKTSEQARADIAQLGAWGIQTLFPELAKESEIDPWVVVILPKENHFMKWVRFEYGDAAVQGFAGIGGAYSHDRKRLVAMDLGPTLRHEFFHVLHWRSCTRHGQSHPVWIQEGLCSLVEEYRVISGSQTPVEGAPAAGPSRIIPTPSWRTNVVKRMARVGTLPPLKTFAAMPRDRFVGTRPLGNYAVARAVFLYLFQQDKLGPWYQEYVKGYNEDSTGIQAMERVLGKPIETIDKDFRAWLKALPEVAEQHRPGEATLGVDVEGGTGDGPVITFVDPKSGARQAGLKAGDVIVAINGERTGDLNELVRLLGEHEVGDEVKVSFRRREKHQEVTVRLVAR